MPLHDGGQSVDEYEIQWDTSSNFDNATGQLQPETLHASHETQAVRVSAQVINEVQTVGATVGVVNERQQVVTSVTGVNEVQTITSTASTVLSEIQTVTTYATDIDEIQVITTTARNVDEIQSVRTSIEHADEVQTVTITGTDEDEVQVISIKDSRRTQTLQVTGDAGTPSVTPEVQHITLAGSKHTQVIIITAPDSAANNITAGQFTLSLLGSTSACVDFDADDATMQATVRSLPGAGAANAEVAGYPYGAKGGRAFVV